jgi:hypothetical protein
MCLAAICARGHATEPIHNSATRCDFALRMDLEEGQTCRTARSRGGLDFALHKWANIAHGDGEIVLSLQVNPELRGVAEITAEA